MSSRPAATPFGGPNAVQRAERDQRRCRCCCLLRAGGGAGFSAGASAPVPSMPFRPSCCCDQDVGSALPRSDLGCDRQAGSLRAVNQGVPRRSARPVPDGLFHGSRLARSQEEPHKKGGRRCEDLFHARRLVHLGPGRAADRRRLRRRFCA